jgi:uncharacterized BrkB/YihY/UPF0761 family membrane protein
MTEPTTDADGASNIAPSGADDGSGAAHDGRIRRAKRRVDSARQGITERATGIEERVPAARSAARAYEHDRRVGGEIMAGAIAFRMFVFLLPLVLVLVVTLGFAADADSKGASDVAKQIGITGLAAQSVAASARVSGGSRWIALFLGLIALYSTSIALARALRIAHALAWVDPVPPMKRTWRIALVVVGTVLAMVLMAALISRINASSHIAGLMLLLFAVVVYGFAWFFVSNLLPHGDADWKALLPGAVLVGFGVEVLHVVTVVYVSHKISTSSKLYGPIGAAAAILFWAYLVGRLAVASAVLNSSVYRERTNAIAGAEAGSAAAGSAKE